MWVGEKGKKEREKKKGKRKKNGWREPEEREREEQGKILKSHTYQLIKSIILREKKERKR